MAKDKTQGMQRIDLRIPDHIYSEIERIAIANNLPYSPTTKPNTDGSLKVDKKGNVIQPKVSVSPIILDLINLGLKAVAQRAFGIASGGENSDKLGDKSRHIEYQVNNQIDVSDIEKKIINTLTQKIEGILSEKILETFKTSPEIKDIFETLVTNKVKKSAQISDNNPELIPDTDNQKSINEVEDSSNTELDNLKLVEDTLPLNKEFRVTADKEINEINNSTVVRTLASATIVTAEKEINEVEISENNHNEDNGQIEINLIDNTVNNTILDSPIVPQKEDLGDNVTLENKAILTVDNSDIKSYEEAVIEINRLKREGNGNTAIANSLTGKYFTKQGKTNWSDTQVRRILKPAM